MRRFGWFIAVGGLLAAGCTEGGQFLPTQIVFTSDRAGAEQVFIMNANGSDVRQISTTHASMDASMSAAGTKIAYTKLIDGILRLYLNNNEGTNEQLRSAGARNAHSAKYNKVGSRLVYVLALGNSQEIWRMDSNGTNIERLTENEFADFSPNWTSGSDVVFVSNRKGSNDIWSMDGNGNDQLQLTLDPADDIMPACKPSGNGVVFSSNRSGTYQLYTMNFDGSDVVQLTTSPGNKFGASYSMGGDKIFFSGDANGNMEIYSINPDGSAETNLTNSAANDTKVGTWVAP